MKTREEKLAYQQGYAAGKRRVEREVSAEHRERVRRAFAERVYLALLPAAMAVDGWKMNGEPVTTTVKRIELAIAWTKKAAQRRWEL